MCTIQLKRGSIEDLKELLPLIHEELDFTKNYVTLEEIDRRLSQRNYNIWIAKDESKSIGIMVSYEENPKVAYAWLGVIQRNYQHNGVGNFLFDSFLKDIIGSGYEKVWAKVGVANIKTLNMFIKYDFRISKFEKERENDIFILEKNLT